jgi:hypothetical protein
MQDISAALARLFAEDEQSQRIYKLLIYINEGVWNAEATQPTEMAMLGLVRQLLEKFPDRTILNHHFHTSVNTLSKPAAYSQIADLILDSIAMLDQSSGEDPSTTFLRTPIQPHRTAETYEIDRRIALIADTLTQQPKQERIKKLMICVQRSVWESDPSRLEMIDWKDILHSLHQQYPQIDLLQKATQSVVDRLSKPIEYNLIAQIALQQLQPLYQPLNLLPNLTSTNDSIDALDDESSDPANNSDSEVQSAFSSDFDASLDPNLDPDLAPMPVTLWNLENTSIAPSIFDLRHDIIKSANPLRVKHILLMLTLGLDAKDALDTHMLRQESTLPLLATAFRLHRKPEILTIKLREITRKLPDPDEYEGTIDAIVRAFKTRSPVDSDRIDRVVPLRNHPSSDSRLPAQA